MLLQLPHLVLPELRPLVRAMKDDLIDKQLVAALLAKYYETGRRTEVLSVLASMLDCTEAQKRQLGLHVDGAFTPEVSNWSRSLRPCNDIERNLYAKGSLVAVTCVGVTGVGVALLCWRHYRDCPQASQKLSDMWVDFLIKEADV